MVGFAVGAVGWLFMVSWLPVPSCWRGFVFVPVLGMWASFVLVGCLVALFVGFVCCGAVDL